MAAGIAQLCVQNGIATVLVDGSLEALGRAETAILRGLQRAEQPGSFSLLRKSTELASFRGCDTVIEVSSESIESRKDILRKLDALLSQDVLVVAATEVLPIEYFASGVENPERLIGMRFFHPAPVARLIEVIRAERSSAQTFAAARQLCERLGKTAVDSKDSPGFIVARLSGVLPREHALAGAGKRDTGDGG